MKKIFITILFILFSISSSKAVNNEGAATQYSINMTHLEMCETGSTESNCLNPVTIGIGDSGAIDIANTTAGVAAASYGSLSSIKFGVSYSYMQVTMKRLITIAGTVSDGSNTCRTKANDGSIATAVAGKTSGDAATISLYIGLTNNGNGNNMNSISAGDGTGTAQAVGVIDNDDTFVQFRGPLTAPITLKPGQIPTMTLAFGFSEALGYAGSSGGCAATEGETQGLYGSSPNVTITIK
jgi:hypothetical protein